MSQSYWRPSDTRCSTLPPGTDNKEFD
jgi:hypothetical protein